MDPSSSRSRSSSKMKRSNDESIFKENDVFVNDLFEEPKLKKNDVFLNYSYEDIGNGFIRHLHAALKRESYEVSDHTLLSVGRDIHLELLNAIQESEIFVPVFSSNYASSLSCLDELVHIMDCFHKFKDRKVLPVFFKVEPSDVKNQRGPFMEAFQAHVSNEDNGRVQQWKQALNEAGNLSGLTMQNGDEAKFLQDIVEALRDMKSPDDLYVTEYPVGLHSRAHEVISKLRLDLKESVLIVAVFGISGIGKTIIVKETYNRIAAEFDIRCFLANIHGLCKVPNWEVVLPNELISCLTRNDKFSVRRSHNDCKTTIRKLVCRRKVLLVLDDVDNYQQLEALGINDPSLFYQGSRIIVTTRDKRSLGHIKHELYLASLLNRRESLNLFLRLMFKRDDPVNTKFIEEVVSLAGGLPLVLKVWSRHFLTCGKEEWASELEELKRIPHGDVHKQLKKSYDSLSDRAKKLFLDIVCFFNELTYYENRKNLVVKVLQDEEIAFFPDKEIRFLADRSLVGMSDLSMPHAIAEMGKEIVRQENEDEPGQRSRLWGEKDVIRVLTEFSGAESVESLMLPWDHLFKVTVQVETLRKMWNLRLLCIYCPRISWSNCLNDEMTPLSFKKLKYMEWLGFPFKSINNFDMCNVVVLKLRNSKLEILWKGMKSLKKLRKLDVRDSDKLTMTGDFYGLENIEELYFDFCRNLKELHNSIGCLQKLTTLNLYGCLALKWIPWEMILNLPSLEKVDIRDTTGLQIDMATQPFLSSLREPVSLHRANNYLITIEFQPNNKRLIPNLPRNITSTKLYVYGYRQTLPLNISNLKSLEFIDFRDWHKLGSESLIKRADLANLSKLKMDYCGLSQVPSEIGNLVSLKELDLSYNTFSSLPDTLSNLSQLLLLKITECHKLRLLPLLPSNIERIEADWCWSLKMMPFDSEQRSYIFRSKMFKESTIPKSLVIKLSQKKGMPGWCSSQKRGGVISFVAPMHLDKKLCGIILYLQKMTYIPKILNKTKNISLSLMEMRTKLDDDYDYMMFFPLDDTNIEVGDSMELEFDTNGFAKCGLRLIYDSDLVNSKLVLQKVNDFPDDYDSNSDNLSAESSDEDDSDDDSMNESDDDDSMNDTNDDNSDCDNDYYSDRDDDFCSDSNDDYSSDGDSINEGDDEDKVKGSNGETSSE